MAIPTSRAEAKKLVGDIARNHGYLSEEELMEFPPELRRKVQDISIKKDLMIGSTVITFVYSSHINY